MTKKYLTGLNRLKVIKEYMAGKENPDWEVFPTRKEGKFIVKPRVVPIETPSNDHEHMDDGNDVEVNDDADIEHESKNIDESVDESVDVKPNPIPKTKPKMIKSITPKPTSTRNDYDPTIGIEILNQLKSLGEEMRSEREAKKQKKLIKETVRHQIYKYPNRMVHRYDYAQSENQTDDDDEYDDSDDQTPISDNKEQLRGPVPPPPMFVRRRLNLLNK